MTRDQNQQIPVFVYGSLKRGFSNFRFLSDSVFVATGVTKFAIFDMFSYGSFPAVCEGTHKISGELYSVTKAVLRRLDDLEGVDSGFYSRGMHDVTLETGDDVRAYMYTIARRALEESSVERYDPVENNVKTWIFSTDL